jgi:hypothetical protein
LLIHAHAADFAREGGRRGVVERQLTLLQRAADLAPTDATIQMLALAFCSTAAAASSCNGDKYDQNLRVLAPDHFISWQGKLDKALHANDTAEASRALNKLVEAVRFDDRDAEVEALVRRAVESARVAPMQDASGDLVRPMDAVIAVAVRNLPMVSTSPTFNACESSRNGSWFEQCTQIAQNMMSTDDLGLADQSLRLQSTMAKPGSIEAQKFERQLHRLEWQRESALKIFHSQNQVADYFREIKNESQLIALLEAHGVSLDPPPDWRTTP